LAAMVTRSFYFYLRDFCRLRFLPARVRSQHPSGVFGIYRASSGRCVSFHQPVWDVTVTERVVTSRQAGF
jgi:hypothetical protein